MRKHSFIVGAIMLALGGFFAKIIGAFYKIPLTNILGSNGVGIYYLVFPLYSLILVVCSSGISVALSRQVAHARNLRQRRNERVYFVVALLFTFVVSLICTLALMIFAREIAFLQGNVNAYFGYFAIAPSVLCASLSTVVKGYFQGVENMIPSSVSMIIEQVVKLATGLIFATRFITLGVEYAVFGAILGVTISELVTLIIMFINFVWHKRRHAYKIYVANKFSRTKCDVKLDKSLLKNNKIFLKCDMYKSTHGRGKKLCRIYTEVGNKSPITYMQAFTQLFKIAVPTTLSNLIMPITSFVDSFLVINLLTKAGNSTLVATSLYGINNGVVSTLIALPVIFTSALSSVIVPNLSSIDMENKSKELGQRSSFFVKLTLVMIIPMFVAMLTLAPDVISLLYSQGLSSKVINEFDFAYKLLIVSSTSIIYNALLQTFVSILQSIDKAIIPFYAMLVGVVVRTIMLVTLITLPHINIFAVVIANTVFLSLTLIICVVFVKKYISLKFGLFKFIVNPIFAGVVSALVVYLCKQMLYGVVPRLVYIIVSAGLCLIVYVALIYALKCFNASESKYFPRVRRIFNKM